MRDRSGDRDRGHHHRVDDNLAMRDRRDDGHRRHGRSRSRSHDRRKEHRHDDRRDGRDKRERGHYYHSNHRSSSPDHAHSRKRTRSPSPNTSRKDRDRDLPESRRTIVERINNVMISDINNEKKTQSQGSSLASSAGNASNKVADLVQVSKTEQETPTADNDEDDDVLIDDIEIDDEFLDPDVLLARRQAEEAELARQAEDRRKRLEAIKIKYDQSQNAAHHHASLPSRKEDEDDEEDKEEQQPQQAGEAMSKETSYEDMQQLDEEEEGALLSLNKGSRVVSDAELDKAIELANDEGQQLAREKRALQEEESAQLNATFAFDMFSDSPTAFQPKDTLVGHRALREQLLEGENPHLQSNWDDGEGYYKPTIGELIGDRFQIQGVLGKGVFSTVLKCVDIRDNKKIVAVKMIRNNDTMRKAAEKERGILLSLAQHDPHNKRFVVRILTYLEYRQHVAMVFEYQQMNLRETLKKFGKDVGINVGAVRIYGRQLMVALRYLMELKVVHADIKLDNILCSEDLKTVKICDFGSAFYETDTDNDPTPYLVSRFYRAPEIILGQTYDRAIDLWSVMVCLYELFTGHVMFPGRTNNEMLRLMMEVKGRFPNKLLRNHLRSYESMSLEPHFDSDCRFKQYETDSVSGKPVLRLVNITQPTRDLATILRSSKAGADDMKLVHGLTDLLEKGLQLDPTKRITVVEALKHPFFVGNKS